MTICGRIVIAITGVLSSGTAVAADVELTKADIPSDLRPELNRLIEDTFSSSCLVRAWAAEKIGEAGQRALPAIPFLIRLLDDDRSDGSILAPGDPAALEHTVGAVAARSLAALGKPALEACIATIKTSPIRRQHAAICCLRRFNDPQALDALLALLEDQDSRIRETAVIALWGCTDTRAILPLIKALGDANSEVRCFAASCLGGIRDPRAVEPLIRALGSWGIWNRGLWNAAVVALGEQRDRRAVPVLQKILQSGNEEAGLRCLAAQSLGKIGDPSVLPSLIALLKDRAIPEHTRSSMAEAIGMLRGQQAFELLAKTLDDDEEPVAVRIGAARGLAHLGDQRAVDLLIETVSRRDVDQMAFWAAISVTKLTNGAISDTVVAKVIRGFHEYEDGVEVYQGEKAGALRSIAEHGKTWWVRIRSHEACGEQFALALIVIVVIAATVIGGIGLRLLVRQFRE
jgi:HEAT repeat protein